MVSDAEDDDQSNKDVETAGMMGAYATEHILMILWRVRFQRMLESRAPQARGSLRLGSCKKDYCMYAGDGIYGTYCSYQWES